MKLLAFFGCIDLALEGDCRDGVVEGVHDLVVDHASVAKRVLKVLNQNLKINESFIPLGLQFWLKILVENLGRKSRGWVFRYIFKILGIHDVLNFMFLVINENMKRNESFHYPGWQFS